MADQTNPWGTAEAADGAAQSADAWGSTPAPADAARGLAEQRARACARTLQHHGSVS